MEAQTARSSEPTQPEVALTGRCMGVKPFVGANEQAKRSIISGRRAAEAQETSRA